MKQGHMILEMAAFLSLLYRISCRRCFSILNTKPSLKKVSGDANRIYMQSNMSLTPRITHMLLTCSFSSSLQCDRRCWKCNASTAHDLEMFFCNCGVVQKIPEDLTFFKVFNCDENFNIDTDELSKHYKSLQMRLHPDKYSNKEKEEREYAELQSAFINKAYWTLIKPLTRGYYLLELRGDPVEETNNTVDMNFLMEIMQINEDIAEASQSLDDLKELEIINNAKIEEIVESVSEAFSRQNIPEAKKYLIKLQYFTNIDIKIKECFRKHMEK